MASPTLQWTINAERGTISFGKTIPFAGNTYDLAISGGDVGETYKAFLMSDNGLECLAQSVTSGGSTTIALNTQGVWDAFVREPHELKAFHLIVRDSGKSVAEGDLLIMWNPLWTDVTSSAVYTMRGPQGNTGATGAQGPAGSDGESAYEIACRNGYSGTEAQWLQTLKGTPGPTTMAKCNADGKWHSLSITENQYGDKVLAIEQVGQEYDPNTLSYVSRTEAQTILGQKTFDISPQITTAIVASDNSTKAATTAWIRNLISAGITTNVTGSILVNGQNTLDAAGAASATAPTPNAGDNSTKIATTAFVKSAVGATLEISYPNLTFEIPAATISPSSNFTSTTATGLREELNSSGKFIFTTGKTGLGYVNIDECPGYTPLFAYIRIIGSTNAGWVGEYLVVPSIFQVESFGGQWRLAYYFHNFHFNPLAVTVAYSIIYRKN